MDSANNKKKPTIKRRNFLYLFGASVVGAIALSKSPLKFITTKFGKEQAMGASNKSKLSIKENSYAVKRGTKGSKNG
jgi:hypothetical protein